VTSHFSLPDSARRPTAFSIVTAESLEQALTTLTQTTYVSMGGQEGIVSFEALRYIY